MNHKRIWSLITACVLSASLITGCGGSSAASSSEPKEAKEEAVASEENTVAENTDAVDASEPAAADDTDSFDVPAAAIDCSFELDGKKYTLPIKPQTLINDGWIDYYDDLSDDLGGTQDSQAIFVKNDKDGNVDVHINVWIYNNTGNKKKQSDCMVSGILVEQGTLEKCSFSLGNGLKPGDDPAAVSELMGTPYYTNDESNPDYFYYGEARETGQIRFDWDKENPSKSYILIEYYPAVEATTSEEVPEYLSSYKAPAAMGEDFDSATFSLDGTLYQLPCPFSELLSQGWTFAIDSPVPAGNTTQLMLDKDGSRISVILKNFADYQTTPSNCAVISIIAYNNEGSFPDLELPKGVTFDTDRSTLESIMESSSLSFESNERDSETSFSGYSDNCDCHFTYNNQDDYLSSVQYSSLSWYW